MHTDPPRPSEEPNRSSLDPVQLQCNDYDFYLTRPTRLDVSGSTRFKDIKFGSVPIIRIYGSLSTGHNVLCHVHGVFPYIFIKYDGKVGSEMDAVDSHCRNLHILLENALRRSNEDSVCEEPGLDASWSDGLQYIADVTVVKGVPFYGFHVGWHAFYKISLLNPSLTLHLSEILRNGDLFGYSVETFESHIPYLLQFTADYNCFGCSWLEMSSCYFRSPVLNEYNAMDKKLWDDSLGVWLNKHLREDENLLDEAEFEREGNGLLEIDVLPQLILNRRHISYRDLHHDFNVSSFTPISDRKESYVTSTDLLWKDIEKLRSIYGLLQYSPPAAISRVESAPNWDTGKLWEFYQKKQAETSSSTAEVDFASFVDNSLWYDRIRTASDAIEDLWLPVIPKIGSSCRLETLKRKLSPSSNNDQVPISLENTADEPEQVSTLDDLEDATLKSRKLQTPEISASLALHNSPKAVVQVRGIPYEQPTYRYKRFPIGYKSILNKIEQEGLPAINYSDPYFSNPVDLQKTRYIYSGKRHELSTDYYSHRTPLGFAGDSSMYRSLRKSTPLTFNRWLYTPKPPGYSDPLNKPANVHKKSSQIAPIKKNEHFKPSFRTALYVDSRKSDGNDLTHMSLELHIKTRQNMLPNPTKDAIKIIFWKMDGTYIINNQSLPNQGMLIFLDDSEKEYEDVIKGAADGGYISFHYSELDLINSFVKLVLLMDPDILSGFEVNVSSWGYLIKRGDVAHSLRINNMLSRVKKEGSNSYESKWNYTHASGTKIAGRHLLNIWRRLRGEFNLLRYTFENITFHFFGERTPHYSHESLSKFWSDYSKPGSLRLVINYWRKRVDYNIRLINEKYIISRITEEARLIGIDFQSVIARGSQFKVESFLVRLCKSERFILLSPSNSQVRRQRALECVPLVMEPDTSFYKGPVIVLDFQALYPSIIMAYNYCYSTMIGRVMEISLSHNEVGVTDTSIPPNLLKLLADFVNISPNGVVFVKEEVRRSALSKMLQDILSSRFMVKRTMQELPTENRNLLSTLDSRQIALKLLANVTYGYTSASYSGRMPCSDIADSIVQTARQTLKNAVAMIEGEYDWGAKVIYGDTDSLFVYLPGKSREQAFNIGNAIASAVTASNPSPVELKFERVFHPCILLSKKRYVGYSYNYPTQAVGEFLAKGIETIRRDSNPAQQKIVQRSLEILFDTYDLSQVKSYITEEFKRIIEGNIIVQDFCFSREVRMGTYANENSLPPAGAVAKMRAQEDEMAEPQYGERVTYLVVQGKSGDRLVDRCVPPEKFLELPSMTLDYEYYITKTLIPPLERFFKIVGLDIRELYRDLPRFKDLKNIFTSDMNGLPRIVNSATCLKCRNIILHRNKFKICEKCQASPDSTAEFLLVEKKIANENRMKSILKTCKNCAFHIAKGQSDTLTEAAFSCDSHDCPNYFSRRKYEALLNESSWKDIHNALQSLDW
ncbi:HEL129Wp [Eremothecium sinecaudum]|uniref:DNA polymerase n=1 Tax=Eremothecium sinecaudum TaxID=45286 RepID=A0A109UZF0_9SACH|nr:HEL129Wp [Eremothecium sinecaudum]AMD21151.1 HEL129Wp [Eremothecium sinecaudum]